MADHPESTRNYTEWPTPALEDRFFELTKSVVDIPHDEERRNQIAAEIRHVVFEMNSRLLDQGSIST